MGWDMKKSASRLTMLVAAITSAASAPAAAAVEAQPVEYSPWAALSAFATQGSSAALCRSAANPSAASATGVSASTACVLPQAGAAASSQAAAPFAAAMVTSSGIGTPPLLAGLAVIASVAALEIGSSSGPGGSAVGARPVSPP
jgi:hypothetical protein